MVRALFRRSLIATTVVGLVAGAALTLGSAPVNAIVTQDNDDTIGRATMGLSFWYDGDATTMKVQGRAIVGRFQHVYLDRAEPEDGPYPKEWDGWIRDTQQGVTSWEDAGQYWWRVCGHDDTEETPDGRTVEGAYFCGKWYRA